MTFDASVNPIAYEGGTPVFIDTERDSWNIYPGDIGMTFFLDRSSFLCAYCGCETNIDGLHLIREKNEYGKISLICDSCLLI